MRRARVLVVDDSVVVRRLLARVIDADPLLEVAATAPNGRIALQKVPQVVPDLVTLDVEMPDMDGIETLRRLRAQYPDLPVVMFSTLTERGAAVTLEALILGANDYVTKPSNAGSIEASMEQIGSSLLPKVRALCKVDQPAARRARPAPAPQQSTPRAATAPRILVIGVSTGGPNALAEIIPALPAAFPLPVLIVQHMPPVFTRLLAERLDARSALGVAEARGGERVAPGSVWLAAGDHHLVLRRRAGEVTLSLNQHPPENSCRPSADVLFRSAAQAYGAGVLGLVLTGMGQDGLRGAEAIVAAGGRIVAQDEASSVVWGMPGAVVSAGLADAVESLGGLAAHLVERGQQAVGPAAAR